MFPQELIQPSWHAANRAKVYLTWTAYLTSLEPPEFHDPVSQIIKGDLRPYRKSISYCSATEIGAKRIGEIANAIKAL